MRRWTVWLVVVLLFPACQTNKEVAQEPPAAGEEAEEGPVPGKNYPQVELAKRKDSIEISGHLSVPGYERGVLQIDVYLPTRHIEGKTPLTTKQFSEPGPWSLLLPAGTEKVQIYAILDFDGDGPSAVDATAEYPGNPIDVREKRTGIDFVLDKNTTKLPPPSGAGGQNRPPWEKVAPAPVPAGKGKQVGTPSQ